MVHWVRGVPFGWHVRRRDGQVVAGRLLITWFGGKAAIWWGGRRLWERVR